MRPFYTKKQSEPERLFIELLANSKKVKWWFKNGESELKYFSILYKDELGIERAFYVDFIVQFEDGSIGLFDTKSGITAKEAKYKAEALAQYISQVNKNRKRNLILGGIAIFKDGSWRYNAEQKYVYEAPNLGKDWKFLGL